MYDISYTQDIFWTALITLMEQTITYEPARKKKKYFKTMEYSTAPIDRDVIACFARQRKYETSRY